MKRFFAIALTLSMLLALCPIGVFAENTITVDGDLSDWADNWISVDENNGYWQTIPSIDTLYYKYQMSSDGEKLYVAFKIDCDTVLGGIGKGTTARLWINSSNDATVYTHLYTVSCDENGAVSNAKYNTSKTENSGINMEDSSIYTEFGSSNGAAYFEFSVDLEEFDGTDGFAYYISCYNYINESVCLFYPAVTLDENRLTNLPYRNWDREHEGRFSVPDVPTVPDVSEPDTENVLTNVAEGKDYVIGNSGYGFVTDTCNYNADLTDGIVTPEVTYDDKWFAFGINENLYGHNVVDGKGSVTVDLGEYTNIVSVSAHIGVAPEVGVPAPQQVEVFFSADSEYFESIGYLSNVSETSWAELEHGCCTRFVKFEFTLNGPFAFIDEIAVNAYADDAVPEEPATEMILANLSKGAYYTTSPLFRQGGVDVQWGWDENAPVSYPDEDGISLTDGIIAADDADYMDVAFAAFHASSPDYVENGYSSITVDLGEIKSITKAILYVGTSSNPNLMNVGISAPDLVEYYISDNGIDWTLLGRVVPNDGPNGTEAVSFECIEAVDAQYVQARVSCYSWMFISEIEVQGWADASEGYDPIEPELPEEPVEPELPDVSGETWKDNQVIDVNGDYIFDNAYGFVFNLDGIDGTINGEDTYIITNADAYSVCNPNWAISVPLRATETYGIYEVINVIPYPGSASAANINWDETDLVLVAHSSYMNPNGVNYQDKCAALALTEGILVKYEGSQVIVQYRDGSFAEYSGEPIEPELPEEPEEPEEPIYSGSCGYDVFWSYDPETCTLTVSGEGDMIEYYSWDDVRPWSDFYIHNLIIEQGVTSICYDAFSECRLTNVYIADSVTYIGDYAFMGCTGITTIAIPGSVSRIEQYAFYGCTDLETVGFADGVSEIGWSAFENCTLLASVYIPKSVTYIEPYAFDNCNYLRTVIYGGTDKEWNAISNINNHPALINAYNNSKCKHENAEWTINHPHKDKTCLDCGTVQTYSVYDVNADGRANIFDYYIIKSFYFDAAYDETLSNQSDVNGDGKVNMFDYVLIKRICLCNHVWIDADCGTLITCSNCSFTEGKKADHTISDGVCVSCNQVVAVSPSNLKNREYALYKPTDESMMCLDSFSLYFYEVHAAYGGYLVCEEVYGPECGDPEYHLSYEGMGYHCVEGSGPVYISVKVTESYIVVTFEEGDNPTMTLELLSNDTLRIVNLTGDPSGILSVGDILG